MSTHEYWPAPERVQDGDVTRYLAHHGTGAPGSRDTVRQFHGTDPCPNGEDCHRRHRYRRKRDVPS